MSHYSRNFLEIQISNIKQKQTLSVICSLCPVVVSTKYDGIGNRMLWFLIPLLFLSFPPAGLSWWGASREPWQTMVSEGYMCIVGGEGGKTPRQCCGFLWAFNEVEHTVVQSKQEPCGYLSIRVTSWCNLSCCRCTDADFMPLTNYFWKHRCHDRIVLLVLTWHLSCWWCMSVCPADSLSNCFRPHQHLRLSDIQHAAYHLRLSGIQHAAYHLRSEQWWVLLKSITILCRVSNVSMFWGRFLKCGSSLVYNKE
jgi:hypothetical protein